MGSDENQSQFSRQICFVLSREMTTPCPNSQAPCLINQNCLDCMNLVSTWQQKHCMPKSGSQTALQVEAQLTHYVKQWPSGLRILIYLFTLTFHHKIVSLLRTDPQQSSVNQTLFDRTVSVHAYVTSYSCRLSPQKHFYYLGICLIKVKNNFLRN